MNFQTLFLKQPSAVRKLLDRGLSVLGLMLVSGFVAHQAGSPDASLELRIRAKLEPAQGLRVYHVSGDAAFSEERANYVEAGGALEGDAPLFRVVMNTPEPVTRLRIDTDKSSGAFEFVQVEWITPQGTARYTGKDLLKQQPVLHDLAVEEPVGDTDRATISSTVRLRLAGPDPFIELQRPAILQVETGWGHQRPWRSFRSPMVLVLGLALLMLAQMRTLLTWASGMNKLARRCGVAWGSSLSVPLGPGAIALLAMVPLAFALNVALKLHNSSLGMWSHQHGGAGKDVSLTWGEPVDIKSDEWFVHTPWLLNQVQTGFKTNNPNVGPPGATLVTSLPVLHPTALVQPQFWGYFLFDVERGLSWHWGFRALSLLTSVYLLLLLLTRGQTLAAAAGSIGVFGSSFVQWWYASWLTEIITGMSCALIGVFVWSHSRTAKLVYPAALIAAFAGMHVVLHPYLPFLGSLAFLGVFVSVALLWESHSSGTFRLHLSHRLLALLLGLAVFAALFWSYYATARLAIEGIMNTVYPGKRIVLGGDLAMSNYLMGLFEFWRDKYQYPDLATNPVESARHLYLFPAVALAALALRKQVRFGAVFWSILAYCVLVVLWTTVPLPDLIRSALAAMGLAYIPPVRMLSGLAIASTLLLVLAVVQVSKHKPLSVAITLVVLALCALVVYGAWLITIPINPTFYTPVRLVVAVVAVTLLMWSVCRGQQAILMAGVLVAAFMPLQLNPFTNGLAPVLDKNLFRLTRALDQEQTEKWAVFGATSLSQLLRANGHEVISGEYYVPRFDLMHHFDPNEKYIRGWNNYGPISFATSDHPERIDFLVETIPYIIKLNPCHPAMTSVGVTRFVFHQRPDLAQMPCLKPLGAFESINIYIYGVKAAGS